MPSTSSGQERRKVATGDSTWRDESSRVVAGISDPDRSLVRESLLAPLFGRILSSLRTGRYESRCTVPRWESRPSQSRLEVERSETGRGGPLLPDRGRRPLLRRGSFRRQRHGELLPERCAALGQQGDEHLLLLGQTGRGELDVLDLHRCEAWDIVGDGDA